MSVVKHLYPIRNGNVRSDELKLPSDSMSCRAIQTLYPVELREDVPECLPALGYPPVEGEKDDDEQFEDAREEPASNVTQKNPVKKSRQESASETTEGVLRADLSDLNNDSLSVEPARPPSWMAPARSQEIPQTGRSRTKTRLNGPRGQSTEETMRPREPVEASGSPGEYVGNKVPTAMGRGRSRYGRTINPPRRFAPD